MDSSSTTTQPIAIQAIPFVPGQAQGSLCFDPMTADASSIVVLHWPQLKQLRQRPAAAIVVGYAPLAHPMIRLFGLGVPTVVINEEQADVLESVKPAQTLMLEVNGNNGSICTLAHFASSSSLPLIQPRTNEPVRTADGVDVVLRASAGTLTSVQRAKHNGAAGIGLLRSELFNPADGSLPDAEFYHGVIGRVCNIMAPQPITVRLIDIAEDKRPPWLPRITGMQGPLGLKGARLYKIKVVRSALLAQLEAIDSLAAHYPLSLMLPFIVHPEEFLHWREWLVQRLSNPIAIGTMIETPAAALALPEFMRLADFVAIGCNDLMQCLFAVDRDIVEVGHLLDPYSPFLFRFIRQLAQSIDDDDLPRVQLCGLLSQIPGILPIMLGLGYHHFSVEPCMIPYLSRTIAETTLSQSRKLANDVCLAHDSGEVCRQLNIPGTGAWRESIKVTGPVAAPALY